MHPQWRDYMQIKRRSVLIKYTRLLQTHLDTSSVWGLVSWLDTCYAFDMEEINTQLGELE